MIPDNLLELPADADSDWRLRLDEAWLEMYGGLGLQEDMMTPSRLLLAWAGRPEGLPRQGTLMDLLNSISLRHHVPAAAYHTSALSGDLWLRPSRGCEQFFGIGGDDRPESPPINEIILVDSGEQVLTRSLHGQQSRSFARAELGEGATLVHLDLLTELDQDPVSLGEMFRDEAASFLNADVQTQEISWDRPEIRWPAETSSSDS